MDDVMPFLENVLRGRNVPKERMAKVAEHYEMFGGVSPINEQNRRMIAALQTELNTNGPRLPVYFGNRNWHPLLADTMQQMKSDGVKHALAFVTSAYSSYSGCRQYLENISAAQQTVGDGAPHVDKLRPFYNHPEFIRANADHIREAMSHLPERSTRVVFTAHSIPIAMAQNCDYQEQLSETAKLIAGQLKLSQWDFAFQSRSGPPSVPWLEPAVEDHLKELKQQGIDNVVLAPIGFISDHMEVVYDLDVEAKQLCDELGINMQRADTAATHPAFIRMIRELIVERLDEQLEKRALGVNGPRMMPCEVGCCPAH